MKKYFTIALTAIIAAVFISCSNDDILISKSISVKIVPDEILSNFYEQYDGNFELSSGYNIRLTILLYNESGELEDQTNVQLSNFKEAYNYRHNITTGNSTIMCLASVVEGSVNNPSFEYYTISRTDHLEGLKVTQQSYRYIESILGEGHLTFGDDNTSNLTLEMKPATALIYQYCYNIHTKKNGYEADKLELWTKNNDIMTYTSGGWKYSSSLGNDTYFTNGIKPSDFTESNTVYTILNFLPTNDMTFFGKFKVGNGSYNTESGAITINNNSAQYSFEFDCATFTASASLYSNQAPLRRANCVKNGLLRNQDQAN